MSHPKYQIRQTGAKPTYQELEAALQLRDTHLNRLWLALGASVEARDEPAIGAAVKVIEEYGQTDGAHHKDWVLDQVVRRLLGERYPQWRDAQGRYYNEGIAP